jgi:hypothetical protein
MAFAGYKIHSTRNGVSPVDGFREDLAQADVVALSLTSMVGVSGVRWTLVDRPEGSSAGGGGPLPITLAVAPTASFTVDADAGAFHVDGTYVVQATINEGTPSETTLQAALARVTNLTIPAAGGGTRTVRKPSIWEAYQDPFAVALTTSLARAIEAIRQASGGGGGGASTLAASYVAGAAAADQTLSLSDARGGGLVVDGSGGGFTGAAALKVLAAAGGVVAVDRATGRLGVGTAAPAKDLHLRSAAPTIRLEDSTGGAPTVDVQNDASTLSFLVGATVLAAIPAAGGVRSDFGLGAGAAPAGRPLLALGDDHAAGVSSAGQGWLRFNAVSGHLEISESTGAWTQIGAGSVSAADTTISFPTSSTVRVGVLPEPVVVGGAAAPARFPNAQALGALATGLLKNTTGAAPNLSVAISGVDYLAPGGAFVVAAAAGAPAGSTNLGILGAGILQQTIAGSTAVPQALSIPAGQVVFGSAVTSGLVTSAPTLSYDLANARLTASKAVAAGTAVPLALDNTSGGASAVGVQFSVGGAAAATLSAGLAGVFGGTIGFTASAGTAGPNVFIAAKTGGVTALVVDLRDGTTLLANQAAPLPTTATGGFVWIPYVGGPPTGVPAGTTSATADPIVLDDPDKRLYMRTQAGAWHYASFDDGAALGGHVLTTQLDAGLAQSFNLGGLATGVLQQSVSGGHATPSAVALPVGQMLHGAASNSGLAETSEYPKWVDYGGGITSLQVANFTGYADPIAVSLSVADQGSLPSSGIRIRSYNSSAVGGRLRFRRARGTFAAQTALQQDDQVSLVSHTAFDGVADVAARASFGVSIAANPTGDGVTPVPAYFWVSANNLGGSPSFVVQGSSGDTTSLGRVTAAHYTIGAVATALLKADGTGNVVAAVPGTDYAPGGPAYVVASAAGAVVNLSAAGTGVLQQTSAGGTATISALNVAAQQVPFGSTAAPGLLTSSSSLTFDDTSGIQKVLTVNSSQNSLLVLNNTTPGFGNRVLFKQGGTVYAQFGVTNEGGGVVQGSLSFGLGGTNSDFFNISDASVSNPPFIVYTTAGDTLVGLGAALATNATRGFVWLPTSAGPPTAAAPALALGGFPAGARLPVEIDSTNRRLYAYVGGAWHYAAFDDGATVEIQNPPGTPLTHRGILAFTSAFAAADDAPNVRTQVDLANVGPGAGAIGGAGLLLQSITLDAKGRVTAAATTSASSYATVEDAGVAVAQRLVLNFSSNFSVADNVGALRTDVDLASIVSGGTVGGAGSYVQQLTTDAKGRTTFAVAGTLHYQQIEDSTGAVAVQRPTVQFSADFAISDDAISGRTEVALAPAGIGAGTVGGGGLLVQSFTLDSRGRVTAATTASVPTSLPPSGAAGGDLGATYPSPTVVAVHESGANTRLTMGTIADGYLVIRTGATLASYSTTPGALMFAGGAGQVSSDAANLTWDTGSHVLTVAGGAIPAADNAGALGTGAKRWASVRAVAVATDHLALSSSRIAWSQSQASSAPGDLTMDIATGRPHAFVNGVDVGLATLNDFPLTQPSASQLSDTLGIVPITYYGEGFIVSSVAPGWLVPGNTQLTGNQVEFLIGPPNATRVVNLFVSVVSSTGGSGSYAFRLTKNGVDTGLAVAYAAGETNPKNNTITIAAGASDVFGLRLDTSGMGSNGTIRFSALLRFTGL